MRVMPMTGGSGPSNILQQALNIPIGTLGISHPDSNAHAPNENIRLDLYLKGAQHLVRVLEKFANN